MSHLNVEAKLRTKGVDVEKVLGQMDAKEDASSQRKKGKKNKIIGADGESGALGPPLIPPPTSGGVWSYTTLIFSSIEA